MIKKNKKFWFTVQRFQVMDITKEVVMLNGKRQGIWGYCYMRQVSYTYFMIGNYNDEGERDGPWGEFNSYEQDFVDGSNGKHDFPWEGCHVETALYYLNKEEPCSDKKTPAGKNLFTNIDVYKNDKVIHSGEFCNHPLMIQDEYINAKILQFLKNGLPF